MIGVDDCQFPILLNLDTAISYCRLVLEHERLVVHTFGPHMALTPVEAGVCFVNQYEH